jgi:protein disulfide-isomerase
MKKIFIVLLLFSASITATAQEAKWFTDANEAATIAIKTKKPLLFFFTGSDWCGWCIKLQKEVLLTPEFVKWAEKNVVLVELDFPKRKALSPELTKQNNDLQQMFAVRGYPTIWFVQPSKKDGKVAFEQLGSTGYVAGGPQKWIEGAESIIKKK